MFQNRSPWIHQLNHDREVKQLTEDLKTDVAIVGAGIAGISTAFYLLKHTDKKVVLLEGYKLAHGATGHNGGQMVTYFERPFPDIVREFGLEMACRGQSEINSSWELVDEIYNEAGLDITLMRFVGFDGLSTKQQVLDVLETIYLQKKGGLPSYPVEIWEKADFLAEIPEKYHRLFTLVSREEISLRLETFDSQYVAVAVEQKGVMNSALFCQEVVRYLLEKYPGRFSLYEHAQVRKVIIHKEKALLDIGNHVVETGEVVLCTNGFENIEIIAPSGLAVNARFHHDLHGVVGFMSGYLEPHTGIPGAFCYFPKVTEGLTDNPGDPYFYVTRRSFEYEKNTQHNLVCAGGPDFALEKKVFYNRDLDFSESAKKQISDFIRHTYDKKDDLEYIFLWHGVMGYTHNLIRMVGYDPNCPRLYYNLGCNGIGLLPSVFGGNKVARQIAGEKFEPSIFDVPFVLDDAASVKAAEVESLGL
jgi:glycine/D-amino acid oxidase-like deaminating enzyme